MNTARVAMMKLLCMTWEKQLTCHPDKTCFVIVGNKGYISKVKAEVEKDPIMLWSQVTKPSKEEMNLGDVLAEGSSQGLFFILINHKSVDRSKFSYQALCVHYYGEMFGLEYLFQLQRI